MLVVSKLSGGYVRAAFEGVGFRLSPGEFVGLLGPNGAGKSTLLKTLSGAIPPLAGQIELGGKPISTLKVRELARIMAVLPQQPPHDGAFSVREVVALGRHPYQQGWGWGDATADARAIAAAMQAVGVESWHDRRMGHLSGGEQQRVRLAQALAQEPKILLLDEPTAWADLNYQLELMRLLGAIAREKDIAVMAVLHDLNQAAQFCSRLLLLHHGSLAGNGTPAEILTEEAIAQAYGVPMHVRYHPETGAPYLLPRMALNQPLSRHQKLHLVAGGGAARGLLPRLVCLGYDMSVGVLNALDSDLELATSLGLACITEAPFAAISAENERLLGERLETVDAVIVAGVMFGPGNLANLRAVAAAKRPTFLLGDPVTLRDFAEGEASLLWEKILANGGIVCEEGELMQRLSATGMLA